MTHKGFVTLVGAGPGDPDLLTLGGRRALAEAEVVLYDRLVGDGVLAFIPETAETIDVGKTKGSHPVPQEEINRLILAHALAGRRVVRLKGGDPYLFGRGAEELEALRENGVPFRVVPGVPSAIAAPAYAGIPVTHRDYSSSLHIVTGHGKGGSAPGIAYRELVNLRGTLVFLMGFSALTEICGGLAAAGMAADTPAALVAHGTRPTQRKLVATIADLPAKALAAGMESPAVLVVGRVAALAGAFDWTRDLPLWGREILAVSSRTTAGRLAEKLRALGAAVDELPAIRREPLPRPEAFWRTAAEYDWIVFTSAFGVDLFFNGLRKYDIDARRFAAVQFAVVGKRTAETLAERGVVADYVPEAFNGESLGRGLGERLSPGAKILLFRAKRGDDALPAILAEHRAVCDDVAAYDTVGTGGDRLGAIRDKISAGRYAAVTFTSASAVEAFFAALPGVDPTRLRAVCIGASTARAAAGRNVPTLVGAEATLDGMVELIVSELRE